jgi:hypothetical protein
MRFFLRELRAAKRDLLIAWLVLLLVVVGGCAIARGDELAESKSRAALALAKAKRERETTSCHFDYKIAVAESRRLRKPLVIWVGVRCAEHPALRRDLADAVHCHVAIHNADRTPRIAVEDADGNEWFVRAEKIGAETARKLRSAATR